MKVSVARKCTLKTKKVNDYVLTINKPLKAFSPLKSTSHLAVQVQSKSLVDCYVENFAEFRFWSGKPHVEAQFIDKDGAEASLKAVNLGSINYLDAITLTSLLNRVISDPEASGVVLKPIKGVKQKTITLLLD